MGLFFADSALLLLVLAFSGTQDLLILWMMTCVVSLFGTRRLHALAIVNILYVLVSGSVLFEQTTFVARPQFAVNGFSLLSARAIEIVLLFAIILGLIKANKTLRYRYVVSINLLFLFALLSFSLITTSNGALSDIVRGTAMLYSKYFWAIAFSVISLKGRPAAESWLTLTALTFWTPITRFHIGAIPRGVGELLACERQSKSDLEHSRRSGIILVAIGSIIAGIQSGLPTVLFNLHYPFNRLPQLTSEFSTTTAPTALLWVDNIVRGLQYFMRAAAEVSIAVGLVRFAGFHIPLAQFKIWKARHFSDLFRRIYFYYSETLTYFFYFPVWKVVRRLRLPRKVEASASLFGSVLFGGLVIHGVLDVPYFLEGDYNRFILLTASRTPYLFMLALLSTLSSVFFKGRQHQPSPLEDSLAGGIRATALILIYLFCLGLVLPTANELTAHTVPSLSWQQLGAYVTKMLGL